MPRRHLHPQSGLPRTFVRVALYASAALLAIAWWQRDALPPPALLANAVFTEPEQKPTDREAFRTTVGGIEYTIRPLFTYDLHGLVVSKHDADVWWDHAHVMANDKINVADLCVVWGSSARSGAYRTLEFASSATGCSLFGSPADRPGFDPDSWSNNHLLTDDPAISRVLKRVRVGDQVHFRGYLAEYSHDHGSHFRRGTSVTRTDTGDQACETVYATDVEITRTVNTGWRVTFWLAMALFVASALARLKLSAAGEVSTGDRDDCERSPVGGTGGVRGLRRPASRHKPLPLGDRAQAFLQLAQMEGAGLPVDRAFAVLQMTGAGKSRLVAMRALLKRLDIASAGERSGLFTTLESRLIRASCAAGSPEQIYRRLGEVYAARAIVLAKARAQMLVPAVVILLVLLIRPLPGLAAGSLGLIGYWVEVLKPLLVLGLATFGVLWCLTNWRRTSKSSAAPEMRWIPVVGPLIVRQNVRDCFESLALLLEAGVPMYDALPLALDAVTEPSVRRDLEGVAQRVAGGATLAQAIAASGFLGYAEEGDRGVSFIASGEASGTLPEMLMRHAALETGAIEERFALIAKWAPDFVYWGSMLCLAIVALGLMFGMRI